MIAVSAVTVSVAAAVSVTAAVSVAVPVAAAIAVPVTAAASALAVAAAGLFVQVHREIDAAHAVDLEDLDRDHIAALEEML